MRKKVLNNLELKVHFMKLNNDPFQKIKAKTKTIEMRLNDEKRQLLNIGDYIVFSNNSTDENIKCQIVNLHKYSNFKDLYLNFDKVKLGYNILDIPNYHDMEEYYSVDLIKQFGVLGIELKVIE